MANPNLSSSQFSEEPSAAQHYAQGLNEITAGQGLHFEAGERGATMTHVKMQEQVPGRWRDSPSRTVTRRHAAVQNASGEVYPAHENLGWDVGHSAPTVPDALERARGNPEQIASLGYFYR